MIDLPVEQTKEPSAQARRFAALSGSFDPRLLRDVLGDASADVTLAVLADLADVCDTGHEEDRWLMRGSVRQREIDNLAAAGDLEDAIAWRRSLPVDDATNDLLAALAGSGGFGEDAVRATIDRDADRDTLKRIAVALDRAGERAPAHAALSAVRSALGRLDMRDRAEIMLSRGFFGRVKETDEIAAWLSRPITSPPVTALFISGLPGIGKSTLVDEAARRAASATPPWILVRLDFDRSGLDVQDRVGLTMEITRQISIELGDTAADLRHSRLLAAGATSLPDPDVKGERREHVPDELSRALGDAVRSAGRPILMILDTLEVLHGRAQTHPGRLFDCLDELCDRGLSPMAVIAAGRGDALKGTEERIGHRIDLGGLDAANADALLSRLEVPSEAFPEIREIADGNPLVLRLAGLAVREAGPEALETARGRRELAAAYLYRFLLSRIGDTKLQALAEPGLVVRRINPDVIAEVLAPQLKVRLEPGEAVTLFERLATHHWLVEPDPTAGWVRHRSDIRSVLIRLLYGGKKAATAARIDRAAAKWFAHRTESFAPVEAAYHRLQATRRGGDLPSIDPLVLQQFDTATIAELPDDAQDYVRSARGERTSQFRAEPLSGAVSPSELTAAAKELEAILERGDIIEAGYVYDRAFAGADLDPRSHEAEVASAFLWRAGRWRAATQDLSKQRAIGGPDDGLRDGSPLVALARLEMLAEMQYAKLVSAFGRDPSLAGFADGLRMRGFKGALGSGALGFALHQVVGPSAKPSWSQADPVAGTEAAWTDKPTTPAAGDALSVGESTISARVAPKYGPIPDGPQPTGREVPDRATPQGKARLLATLTPYASTAEALRSLEPGRLMDHLTSVDFDLAAGGGLPPSGTEAWSVAPATSPDGSIDGLAALGLLAEWLGAAAFTLRHPDLRLLARAADRWRRTAAGDWAYSLPNSSAAPPWIRRPDATIQDRVNQLLESEDPVEASVAQLRIWWGSSRRDAADPAGRIERRLPGAVRAANRAARRDQRTANPMYAAAELQRRTVPSAFVPPIAVLVALDRMEGRRSK